MGFFVDRKETFPITVRSPEGEEATVELRKLSAGDYADRSGKMMKIEVGKDPRTGKPTENVSLDSGGARLFTIHRSIVRWDLPAPLSFQQVRNLDDDVQTQIYDEIKKLNPRLARSDMDLMDALGDDGEASLDPTDEEYGDDGGQEEDPT